MGKHTKTAKKKVCSNILSGFLTTDLLIIFYHTNSKTTTISGASFAEALGMINPGKSTPSSKKKSSHSSSNHSSSSKSRSNGNTSNKEDKPLKKEQNPATLSLQSKLVSLN